jgi:MATE family multidrug resistance protein
VGQALGAKDVRAAIFITNSALHLAIFYMGLAALCFVLFPMPFLEWFRPPAISGGEFARITGTGVEMLRLVAFYCLFDAVNIVYSGALRGAGDTRFVMSCMLICSTVLMVAPTALAVLALGWGIMFCWYCLTLYVCALGFIFWRRFRGGAWRNIEVVESGRAAAEF